MQSQTRYRPWLWRHLLAVLLLAGVLPVLLLIILQLSTAESGESYQSEVVDTVSEVLEHHTRLNLDTQAQGIGRRLNQIGFSVLALKYLSAEVLSAPEIYCAYAGDAVTPDPESGSDEAPELKSTPREDPLFYRQGEDGAFRKPLAVGSAVFYQAREYGRHFTRMELQRLYALAAVDSLLQGPTDMDPLCGQLFVLTHDGLLRTYPYRDVINSWDAYRDLNATTLYAWSADKADSHGLVWTSPYLSLLSGEWVIACLAQVDTGERQVAVVGCEIPVAELPEELLTFSLASGGMCWLQRADGLVLAVQGSGSGTLGVTPMASAPLPTDNNLGVDIKAAANLFSSGNEEIADKLKANGENITADKLLLRIDDGDYLLTSLVADSGWFLCGLVESPALSAVEGYAGKVRGGLRGILLAVVLSFAAAIVLAFVLSGLTARRITGPLRLLASEVQSVVRTGRSSRLTVTDEGETGALGQAVQQLVDHYEARLTSDVTAKVEQPDDPAKTADPPAGDPEP